MKNSGICNGNMVLGGNWLKPTDRLNIDRG